VNALPQDHAQGLADEPRDVAEIPGTEIQVADRATAGRIEADGCQRGHSAVLRFTVDAVSEWRLSHVQGQPRDFK